MPPVKVEYRPHRCVPALLAGLASVLRNPDVQIKVMHALAVYMYDRKAAPQIAQQMFSPHESVARKAISCIKHLDYSVAVPDLKRLRDTSTMPGVVRAAQNAIVYFRRHG